MTDTPNASMPSDDGSVRRGQPSTPPSGAGAEESPTPRLTPAVPRIPSFRVSAALAAAMLAIGIVVGRRHRPLA